MNRRKALELAWEAIEGMRESAADWARDGAGTEEGEDAAAEAEEWAEAKATISDWIDELDQQAQADTTTHSTHGPV